MWKNICNRINALGISYFFSPQFVIPLLAVLSIISIPKEFVNFETGTRYLYAFSFPAFILLVMVVYFVDKSADRLLFKSTALAVSISLLTYFFAIMPQNSGRPYSYAQRVEHLAPILVSFVLFSALCYFLDKSQEKKLFKNIILILSCSFAIYFAAIQKFNIFSFFTFAESIFLIISYAIAYLLSKRSETFIRLGFAVSLIAYSMIPLMAYNFWPGISALSGYFLYFMFPVGIVALAFALLLIIYQKANIAKFVPLGFFFIGMGFILFLMQERLAYLVFSDFRMLLAKNNFLVIVILFLWLAEFLLVMLMPIVLIFTGILLYFRGHEKQG